MSVQIHFQSNPSTRTLNFTPEVWVRRKQVTAETKCYICDLIAKGYSHYNIAKIAGCTVATVHMIESTLALL